MNGHKFAERIEGGKATDAACEAYRLRNFYPTHGGKVARIVLTLSPTQAFPSFALPHIHLHTGLKPCHLR